MRTVFISVGMAFGLFSNCILAASCDGFVDVDTSASYCTAVTYVQQRGVTIGCSDATHYCPDDFVTRAQMALFLQRMGQADPTNTLGDHTTTIGGGTQNTSIAPDADGSTTVAGGTGNSAMGDFATVGGGSGNQAAGAASTIVGGSDNGATGIGATVVGGANNTAGGIFSLALGIAANADQDECAVLDLWSEQNAMDCHGTTNIFKVGSDHGLSVDYHTQNSNGLGSRFVAIGDTSSGNTIVAWNGATLTDGGAWTNASDRNLKTDFELADPQAILRKVAALPMDSWSYKAESGQRHIGPMAQDFYAAFGLGADDKHITTVDEGGVALAAIQGLNAKLEARDVVIASQAKRLNDQSRELEEIKGSLATMAGALAALTQERK